MRISTASSLFSPISVSPTPDNLAVGTYGLAGAGKTAFLCTMPGMIGIIPLDSKTRGIVEKRAYELGVSRKIVMPPRIKLKNGSYMEPLIRHANPMLLAMLDARCKDQLPPEPTRTEDGPFGRQPVCCAIHYYRWHVNRIRDYCNILVEDPAITSIGIDNGYQLEQDMLMSCYGRALRIMPRDRGEYNQAMRDILYACRMKHFCITHPANEIWVGEDEKSRKPSGKYDWKGWKDLDYACNVIVEQGHDDKKGVFWLSVRRCNDNPALLGRYDARLLEDGDVHFQNLAMEVFPEFKEEILAWE